MLHRFEYLKYSLSIVLIFIGLKVFYNGFVGMSLRLSHWPSRSAFWPRRRLDDQTREPDADI